MKIKGLLFDLDGVIVETAKYHYLAWSKIAEELDITFTLEDNERLKGVSRTKSFEILLEIGNVKLSEEKFNEYCRRKNEIYLSYINKMEKEEILPGVGEFIMDARDKGYKIALGSASKNSMTILERLDIINFFDAIVDGTSVSKAKPDPEVFLNGALKLDLKPEECLVFEDSFAGIDAAHNGNIKAVGIGSSETLKDADLIIEGFNGININTICKSIK